MDLNEIAIFLKVVQAGSFTKAAAELGMPNSTVSTKISSLERRLGVTLIQRTTRRLNVTPAGQAFFLRCSDGLKALQAAEADLAAIQAEPQGLLRLTAPAELGNSLLADVVSRYTRKFPKVEVEVLLSDRVIDLVAEGVDLAIRAGDMKDTSLMARKIGAVEFGLFASPRYLTAEGPPKSLRDLSRHRQILFTPLAGVRGEFKIPKQAAIRSNDMKLVKFLTMNGDGFALLPTFFCYPEVQAGKLRRVLPDHDFSRSPIHFVYPAQKFVPLRVSAFISFSFEVLRKGLVG